MKMAAATLPATNASHPSGGDRLTSLPYRLWNYDRICPIWHYQFTPNSGRMSRPQSAHFLVTA